MSKSPTVVEAAKTAAAAVIADAEVSVAAVPGMIAALEQAGISAVYIERVLQLPLGSVKKWLAGEISPEELALLKIVCFFPRILEVADAGYDQGVASAAVVVTAGEFMLEEAKERALAKRKAASETASATPVPKDWVDALKVDDRLNEKAKDIEYTVLATPNGFDEKFSLAHDGCKLFRVFPEFIRINCAPGPLVTAKKSKRKRLRKSK